jgi:hypothetical protein
MSQTSALIKIPENTSFVQPNKFTFEFPTMPYLRYFLQSTLLPGVSTTAPVQYAMGFADAHRHGDKLVFDQLSVAALIDEDMRVWEETFDWLCALTKPDNFGQYARFKNPLGTLYHDAILTVNTNANNPNMRFKFTNVHPVTLGAINFAYNRNADEILLCDIVFSYDQYYIQRLTND